MSGKTITTTDGYVLEEKFQWVDEYNQLHWLTQKELDEKNEPKV